jgi:tetratricopeptide (TPR) repeat protein
MSGTAMTITLPRLLLALALAFALGAAAIALARVDADLGAPAGADRLLQAIDADPALQPTDAERARAMLRSRPIDGRAYRVLAQVADARGDHARADALYAIAVRRAPRDRPTRAALADRAFATGDYPGALQQLDALLRVAPGVRVPVLQGLMPYLGDARLRAALVDRLTADPPWRDALIPVLLDAKTPPAIAVQLLAELAAGTSPTERETDTRITLLQRMGRSNQARQLWLARLPAGAGQGHGLLFDGGFEHPDISGGYGWRQAPPPGVSFADDRTAPVEGNHALAIDFSGRAVTTPGLEQWLALPAGDYHLAFASDNGTDALRPFAWQLRCQGDGRLLASLPLPAAAGWQHGSGNFTVPPGCPGQSLRLDYLGRSLAERQFSGSLRLDALQLQAG